MNVIGVDYWGDQDLLSLTNDLIIVKNMEAESNLDKGELLAKWGKDAFNKNSNIEGILIGSGLDDRPDLWEELNALAPIYGNSPEVLKKARDVINLFKKATKKGISCPITKLATSNDDAIEIARDINYPVVIKPLAGAGGVHIRIAFDKEQLNSFYSEIRDITKKQQVLIQEFVKGDDISSTILSTVKKSITLSINEQIIGLDEVNAPSTFSYCGNFIPLELNYEARKNIESISKKLSEFLKLKGMNGIDFVLKGDDPHLMEINPRFPGTFELLENILEVNLMRFHLDSCKEKLPSSIPTFKKCGVKYVLFSDGEYIVPDLSSFDNTHDVPFPNTKVVKGSPICTIQTFGSNKNDVIVNARSLVTEIYSKLEKVIN